VTNPYAERPDEEAGAERVRVTDRRRIDPQTGAVRGGQPSAAPAGPGAGGAAGSDDAAAELGADLDRTSTALAEVTADLQRVHAEYANYRKRVERDRDVARETAVAATFAELLPVLDDVGRAREHGELDGAFRAVGEALEATVVRLGLERFGSVGDPFDPTIHEALTHEHRDDVTEPVCVAVYQPGYRYGGRVVRPARVGVAEPGGVDPGVAATSPESG
jgi:molecular chaperone GrpE